MYNNFIKDGVTCIYFHPTLKKNKIPSIVYFIMYTLIKDSKNNCWKSRTT